jgi:uncharacterized protein
LTSTEDTPLGSLGPATWTRVPPSWALTGTDTVAWTCSPVSDFWRETGGVPGAHDGNALLATVDDGDFDFRIAAAGLPSSAYDQFGLFVLRDDRRWVKAGVELDETLWLSVVATNEFSDWSRERHAAASVTLRATREVDALRIFVGEGSDWRMIRELTFTGQLSVGVYSCAPKGAGFPALARVERS